MNLTLISLSTSLETKQVFSNELLMVEKLKINK